MSLRNFLLRKRLQFLYLRFILYVKRNFDLKIIQGEPDTKDNLEKIYKQTTLLKVLDHSKSIILLTLFGQESCATLHPRTLLETYLQARLLKAVDSEAGYRSFWYFAAYNEYSNLKLIVSDPLVIKPSFKNLLNRKIAEYEIDSPERKYIDQLDVFKTDFDLEFTTSPIKPKKDYNWWAGLSPKNIATLFPDGALEIYLKLYWDISGNAHSNPRSNFNYAVADLLHKGGNTSLIMGLNLSIWTAELYAKDKHQTKELKAFMNELSDILIKHHKNKS